MSEKLEDLKEKLAVAKLVRKYTWNAMKSGQLDVKIGRLEREIKEMEKDYWMYLRYYLFILSFIALFVTIVVMSIRKSINKGKGDFKEKVESTEISSSGKMCDPVIGRTTYETFWDLSSTHDRSVWSRYKQTNNNVEFVDCTWSDESWMKREVNETQEKWKETIPKHSTRVKLREARKLRNKRKGKKK